MTEKYPNYKLDPELLIYAQNDPFDNAFVDIDNPNDAQVKQFGNGETLVKHDNPDDLEDMLVR